MRLIATTSYPKNFRENNFDKSLVKNLEQDNEDSEIAIAESPFIDEHKSWFLNTVNFLPILIHFVMMKFLMYFTLKEKGTRYMVFLYPQV